MTKKNDVDRCLRYIKVYLEEGDSSVSRLRGFLDDWYGYSIGGSHLTRHGNVRWLNNPDHTKPTIRECLEGMDFISGDARDILDGKVKAPLIKEHAVPVKVLRTMLRDISEPTIIDIQTILKKYYKLGVLTKSENKKLDGAGLNSSMPKNWDGKDAFARYKVTQITGSETESQ